MQSPRTVLYQVFTRTLQGLLPPYTKEQENTHLIFWQLILKFLHLGFWIMNYAFCHVYSFNPFLSKRVQVRIYTLFTPVTMSTAKNWTAEESCNQWNWSTTANLFSEDLLPWPVPSKQRKQVTCRYIHVWEYKTSLIPLEIFSLLPQMAGAQYDIAWPRQYDVPTLLFWARQGSLRFQKTLLSLTAAGALEWTLCMVMSGSSRFGLPDAFSKPDLLVKNSKAIAFLGAKITRMWPNAGVNTNYCTGDSKLGDLLVWNTAAQEYSYKRSTTFANILHYFLLAAALSVIHSWKTPALSPQLATWASRVRGEPILRKWTLEIRLHSFMVGYSRSGVFNTPPPPPGPAQLTSCLAPGAEGGA